MTRDESILGAVKHLASAVETAWRRDIPATHFHMARSKELLREAGFNVPEAHI